MNNKNLLCLFLAASLFFILPSAYAATQPSVSSTPEDNATQIRDRLITNIASRVAQLKLVEKRGIIGKVNEVANTQITITDSQNNIRFIDVDELTKFSNPATKGAFGISDITKNSTVGILGLYNKDSRRILARFIDVISAPAIIHGGISEINNVDYTLKITTQDGRQMVADIENLTRTYSYTQKDGLLRAGFSKIKENSSIIVIGVLNKTEENRLTATRVMFFPEIPLNSK
jgi:hypothetical protein